MRKTATVSAILRNSMAGVAAAMLVGPALIGSALIGPTARAAPARDTREAENARLLTERKQVHGLSDGQVARIRAIFGGSPVIGQGNPAITHHPMTRGQCPAKLDAAHLTYANLRFERICGRKYMAPLYDPRTQRPK